MTGIEAVLDFDTGGRPTSHRKWCRMSLVKIAECLGDRFDIRVSATTVGRLLEDLDYSLKANRKCLSSGSSPHRDVQFGIIRSLREQFAAAGDPIISVDTKKKERIGPFKNAGRRWCRTAPEVNDHDFRSEALAIASPYGIYDVLRNCGMLVVGTSADTPEFAVNAIDTWWQRDGSKHYPHARRLLLLADSGGSNGASPRAFKRFLQEKIADAHGLTVTVAHYPSGASTWNPIEHRMFSEITKTWAGHPLESTEILLRFAQDTSTTTGLRVTACLDERQYQKGLRVTDKEISSFDITRRDQLGKWNYQIAPRVAPEALIPSANRASRCWRQPRPSTAKV